MSVPRDPTRRFGDRVADYARHRPSYPPELPARVLAALDLGDPATVADVGAGTGLSCVPWRDAGHRVIAVEPNDAMRAELVRTLPDVEAVAGRASATGLADASVDLVQAAQAFHWFDAGAARREFRRIARGSAPVALVWNDRRDDASAFATGYEALLREHGTDYGAVDHRRVGDERFREFFRGEYGAFELAVVQRLDREGLHGRVRSCSYMPAAGQPGFGAATAATDALFDTHARDGTVELVYATRVVVGRLE